MYKKMTGNTWEIAGILLLFISLGLFSCSDNPVSNIRYGTLSGRVLDDFDNSPIEGANVTTTPTTSSIITDSKGVYIINDIKPGSYSVKTSKDGYKNAFTSIIVSAEKITTADIKLNIIPSINLPPEKPFNSFPQNGATGQKTSLTLSWSALDPDVGDSLLYSIRFGNEDSLPLPLVATDIGDTTFKVDNLSYNTTYFWQVIVKDSSEESVNGVVWNFKTEGFPDNHIVFASSINGNFDIYSASAKGGDIVQLTDELSRDWWPKFNPNRERIAFTSDRSIAPQIYIMNTDGSFPRKVTTISIAGYYNYGIGFCWSHDGYNLYYSRYNTLYRVGADGSNLMAIAEAPDGMNIKECAASPIGDKIAIVVQGSSFYSNALYIMNTDGSDMKALVEDLPGTLGHPDFSVDGKTIVYHYDVSGYESTTERLIDSHIFSINTDGTNKTDLSVSKQPGTNDIDPVWSPDNAKILFVNVPNDGSLPPDIYTMDYEIWQGTERKRTLIISNAEMPDWK